MNPLPESMVIAIRNARERGLTQVEIARGLGIAQSTVSGVLSEPGREGSKPRSVDAPRAVTIARKRLAKQVLQAYRDDPLLQGEVLSARLARPKCRGQCVGGPRPCPWVACRYHLALDVSVAGGLKENFPGIELEDMPATCALDVADQGGATLEAVAAYGNLVRERVRQIETRILLKLRDSLSAGSLKEDV